jgi:hypothetical protein
MTEKEIKQRNKHRNISGSLEMLNPDTGVCVHACACGHAHV